jgi:type I restriction enzyme, S subunit
MKKWEEKRLDELGKVARGKSRHRPRNAPHLFGGKYPFIQTGDIEAAEFYINSYSQTYNEVGLAQSKLWPKETLCISIVGANTGASGILDFEACFPDSVIGFIAFPKISDVKFIKYSLTILRNKLKNISEGAARENLSMEKLLTVKIPVPPFPIQCRISSILSAYDDLIENNLKRIKLLEEVAQRTYEEWFVKFRIDGVQLEVNEETGIPKGWKMGHLEDLVTFQSGFAFKSSKFVSNGYPVIKIKNIGNNTVDIINTDCVEKDYAKIAVNYKLNHGDLLIAMTGATIGKVGYMPYSVKNCYLNQRVGRFINFKDKSNIHLVFSIMTQGNGLQQILNLAGGAAQPNISGTQILSIETVMPNDLLLLKYNEMADKNFIQILNLQSQNRLLKESRDILLPKLMSGQIEV